MFHPRSPGRRLPLALLLLPVLVRPLAAQELKIVATIPDLQNLVERIGGQRVETLLLVPPGADPHRVRGKPSVLLQLQRADGLICMGLDYEHAFLPALLEKCRNERVKPGGVGYEEVGRRIEPLQVPDRADRGQGADLHPRGNPHFNLDPENGRIMARSAFDLLARLDPAHRDEYEERWRAWDEEAVRRIEEWKRILEPCVGEPLVVYHDSWPYFARRFGLRVVGTVEPKPGIAPTARHLLDLARRMRGEGVRVVLYEPWYHERDIAALLEETGARALSLGVTAGFTRGTEDYLDFVDTLVRRIGEALGCTNGAEAGGP